MKKLLIVPRSPENARFDFEGHGYYENFYPAISENFETVVLSSAYDEPRTEENLTFYPWKFENRLEGIKGIYSAINQVEPDIVMTEDASFRTMTAFTIAKLKRIPTVMKVEAIPRSKFKTFFSSVLANKISSVAHTVDKHLPRKSTIVRPGTKFPDNIEPMEFSQEKETIGYLGRLHHDKGTDRYIQMVKSLAQEKDLEFKAAGIGDYKKEELKKMDKEHENFEFLGKIPTDDIFPYLAGLDATIVPSRIEGCTRVVVESLYAETPILAWNIEPHKEMIQDEKLLVKNMDELTHKIQEQTYNQDLCWFNYEKYTVENEIKGMTQIMSDLS